MPDQEKRTEIQSVGEFGLIKALMTGFPLPKGDVVKGVGDDAAVLDYSDSPLILLSTDMLVEGIHFDLMYTPLMHLGYKAVATNVSDICAMNGRARQITVSLAISNRFSVEALQEIYAGVRVACKQYAVDLVGGDTTSSPKGLIISVSVIGTAPVDRVTYRNTAKVGDLICITGDLGAAYLGLQILEREKRIFLEDPQVQPNLGERAEYLIKRQLRPEARVDVIDQMTKANLKPTSMIDISDGLASEIHHLCSSSKVGALIDESGVPIHPDAQMQALEFKLDPITCALSGGEDYELLFTVDPKDLEIARFLTDVYIAGEIVAPEQGIKLRTMHGNLHDIVAQGWNHFGA
jgi:thiamine-monophosphate kinase